MMSLHTQSVHYGDSNQYVGYLAQQDSVQAGQPAVIVLQEIWGVDEHIEDVTRRFAEAGYVAFAPDLYAVNGQRKDGFDADSIERVKQFLETVPPTAWHDASERDKAMDALPEPDRTTVRTTFGLLFGGLDLNKYTDQLLATTAMLRAYPVSKAQPIVSIGFCMGGGLSAVLAASDEDLAGAAIFYGSAPSDEQIQQIACPVRGFYGALDQRITDSVPAFSEQMKQAGKSFEYRVYKDAHHAFFNDTRASYNPAASRAAFAEVLGFFSEITTRA